MKLRDGLRAADEAFQSASLPPQALAELRRRVFDTTPVRWRPMVLVGLVAAVVVAAVAYWPRSSPIEDVHLAAGESYAPAAPRGVNVTASTSASLHRDHDRVQVLSGTVTFTVEKRRVSEEPVRVDVSHGTIEVVGTRFTVRQRDDGGDVTLHEGVIRFGDHTVHAGESLAWPEPPPEVQKHEATPHPREEAPPEPTARQETTRPRQHARALERKEPAIIHETDAAWLLEEVDVLRSRGEYGDAVRLLEKGVDGIVSAVTRERFSYELGSILTYQVNDKAAACLHWSKHTAAFPDGRYTRSVTLARERSNCAP